MIHPYQAETAMVVLRRFDCDNIRFDSVYSTKNKSKGGGKGHGSDHGPTPAGQQQLAGIHPASPVLPIPQFPAIVSGPVVVSTISPMQFHQQGYQYQYPSGQYDRNYHPPFTVNSATEFRPYHIMGPAVPPAMFYGSTQVIPVQQNTQYPIQHYQQPPQYNMVTFNNAHNQSNDRPH